MVENSKTLSDVFHALASDARRNMLDQLAEAELSISQLAAPLTMSLAGASKHVQVLEHAGLIKRTVDGRLHICRLETAPLAAAFAWLAYYQQFWNKRLDSLESLFQTGPVPETEDQ
jgi:DNA-binding transcriptional ArsR family regulator